MLFVCSTLLLVNAATLRREKNIFNRVACLILLYSGVIFLGTGLGIYGGLYRLLFITHSFDLFICIIGAIVLGFSAFYLRRLQEPMRSKAKKIYSLLLTKYTENHFWIIIIWIIMFFEIADYNLLLFTPVLIYDNADTQKEQIIKENKGKAGVYCFTNLINGKKYIGSSEDLRRRMQNYFNINYLTSTTSMPICSALQKYGYSNFSLEILEYCDPSDCISREDYFIKLFSPEYNIIQDPTLPPMSGRTHSIETLLKMSAAKIGLLAGDKHPMFGKKHSAETLLKLSAAKKGENNPMFGKSRPVGAGSPSQQISVLDTETNLTTTYDSIGVAARALNLPPSRITKYFSNNQQKPYKGRYIFKKL